MSTATATRAAKTRLTAGTLKAALRLVEPAVPGRTSNPVLHNVLLSGGTMTATNGELRVTVPVDCDADCLLPHARLLAIANSCPPDAAITLTPKGTTCAVKCGSGKWLLPSADASEFPAWPVGKTAAGLSLPADQLLRAVLSVIGAASRIPGPMAALLVEVLTEGGRFVTTDGHRMALAEVEHGLAVDESRVLIPTPAAEALIRLAESVGDEAEVQFRHTDALVQATVGEAVLTCRQMAGSFPNYRKVDAEPQGVATVVDRNELLSATRAAAVVTSENSRGVAFVVAGGRLTISGKSAEYGSSSVSCVVVESGADVSFTVNPAYVSGWLDALHAEAEPHAEFEVVDGRVLLRCGEFRTVIMPLAT